MIYGSVMEATNTGSQAVLEVLRTNGDVRYLGFSGVIAGRAVFDDYRRDPILFHVEAMVLYDDAGRELVQWPQKE